MADPPAPAPANPAQDENADPAPANPNAPAPNQPAPANPVGPALPVPNQPVPQQPVPNQPVPMQPAPAAPDIIYQQVLNWSHCKPEFSGRPEKDAEAHLLCTNDWMETGNFLQDVKVQRFFLTFMGEARLWYESLTPIANDWSALQENFRRQYSKIGNNESNYSMHGDHSTMMKIQTVEAYVSRIRQVVAMLGHGEPQILEVFKNTIPNRIILDFIPHRQFESNS